jgi:RNA polymerase sigma factor (sigma-70 family)
MATLAKRQIVRHLCGRLADDTMQRESDGTALERFIHRKDPDAFALLVRRHGAMVFAVCRRQLGDFHDAEDAFQATFLVLSRRAASVSPRDAVGNWLHGVAYRTALRIRSRRARILAKERAMNDLPHPEFSSPESTDELRLILDREICRLPDKYRLPVILCELEGRPRREVAVQLLLAEGTLSSRLANARRILARRLSRTGLSLCGPALVFAVCAETDAVSPRLTRMAEILATSGRPGTVNPHVLKLAKEEGNQMFFAKLLKVACAGLVGTALVAGLGRGAMHVYAGDPPAERAAAVPPPAPRARPALPGEKNELQIMVETSVCEGDPLGNRKDGTLKIVAAPRMTTLPGQAAQCFIGAEQPIPIKGIAQDPGKFIPSGFRFNITAKPLSDHKYLLDATVESTVPGNKSDEFVEIHASSTRLLRVVEPGQTVKVRCRSSVESKDVWAEFKITEVRAFDAEPPSREAK